MPALDLSALSPEVTLLGTTIVAGPRSVLTSTPVTGFSDVASATVVVRVERVDNSNGEALSVTVQGSEDGNSWSTVAGPYSFARDGTESLVVDDPPDRLRVAWSAPAGVREAAIGSVTARLGVVDAPGGESGGSQPGLLSADFLFTEVADSATYTATLPVEAGTVVLDVILYVLAGPWAADFPCPFKVVDTIHPDDAYMTGDLGGLSPAYDLAAATFSPGSDYSNAQTGGGQYDHGAWNVTPDSNNGGPGIRYAEADTITIEVVTNNAVPVVPAGVTLFKVIYLAPVTATDATVVPA